MSAILLNKTSAKKGISINVPGSKSESNRALIINALCESPGKIDNLAIARDTETMQRLLSQQENIYDVLDAGTTMRFLTAYLSVKRSGVTITGTERMQKRPIRVLVEALRQLGANIEYLKEEGYPPLRINRFETHETNKLVVSGGTSSQYISALLMIGPSLTNGLELEIKDGLVSRPYVDMTLALMKHFGAETQVSNNSFLVKQSDYTFRPFSVESDWSGVSYWYSFFKLSDLEELKLPGFRKHSFQGDSAIATIMDSFGVATSYENDGLILTKKHEELPEKIEFVDCPDLAQTVAVLCAAIGHKCVFTGLQTLKIKETDRVAALKNELNKFGADFVESGDEWTVIPSKTSIESFPMLKFHTYEDHRMAMAFAPLCLLTSVEFDEADVVNKSYPTFWTDLDTITS